MTEDSDDSGYPDLVESVGEANEDGESWQEAAERIRGDRDRLHPLAQEVFADGGSDTDQSDDSMTDGDTTVEAVRCGPIIFGNETAREHLLTEGEVYTFRTSNRTTGDTWARASRTGEKIADVTVECICPIPAPSASDLDREWAAKSGFGTPEQWWDAIESVHGEDISEGYVFRCTLRGDGVVKRD